MEEQRQHPYDHEHVAEHRGTDGICYLYETPANHPKWANSWRPETNEEHEHEWHSPLDLVHDHGRGPHHHHISVVDSAVRILYWMSALHPSSVSSQRSLSRDQWAWVCQVMADRGSRTHSMASGYYITTSDSRLKYNRPVPLHNRYEV